MAQDAPPLTPACLAVQEAVVALEAREVRRRAELEAQRTGDTVEEVLALRASYDEEDPDARPPVWTCPAQPAPYHLPQPTFAPVAVMGAQARPLAAARMGAEGEVEYFLYVLFEVPGEAPQVQLVTGSSDANGQEWSQVIVVEFEDDGGQLFLEAHSMSCVPAGFDEETENEPPSCSVYARYELRCGRDGDPTRCETMIADN